MNSDATTKHVLFVHGLLGSELVDPTQNDAVYWGNALALLRLVFRPSTPLAQVEGTHLRPRGLTANYRSFVRGLRTHLRDGAQLDEYIYDWRFGLPDACSGLNHHLDTAPVGTSIVAHSYGALVVLYALASGGIAANNVKKLKRVIVIASPYYGASFALLGLGQSLDFVKRLKPFLPFGDRWQLDVLLDRFPELVLRRLVPILSSFQSMYDLIPHDFDIESLRLLTVPGSRKKLTSERWQLLGSLPEEGMRKKEAARAAQAILRTQTHGVEVVSVFSSAINTPHYCRVGDGPAYALIGTADERGDGIVAACCTNPAKPELSHELDWTEVSRAALGHSEILHHPRTHELLEELLARVTQ